MGANLGKRFLFSLSVAQGNFRNPAFTLRCHFRKPAGARRQRDVSLRESGTRLGSVGTEQQAETKLRQQRYLLLG